MGIKNAKCYAEFVKKNAKKFFSIIMSQQNNALPSIFAVFVNCKFEPICFPCQSFLAMPWGFRFSSLRLNSCVQGKWSLDVERAWLALFKELAAAMREGY
jgi:hypothetical protein